MVFGPFFSIWRYVCPFDYTAVAGVEKIGPLNLRLTTPVG